MKPLRVSLLFAGMTFLAASTLSAQATRISCKDGSKPKVGHFSCWGHGGLVRETPGVEQAGHPKDPSAKPAKKAKTPGKVKKATSKKKTHEKAKKSKKKHKKQ